MSIETREIRSKWKALHRDLAGSVGTREAERQFEALRSQSATIARFGGPQALVDFLAHVGGDLDEKDQILLRLASATRAGASARLAMALLLLGMWPGLDRAFARRARLRQERPGELEAEMVARFADQVGRLDAGRVHRVAATLVRSTEREVVRARLRDLRRRRRLSDLPLSLAERLRSADCAGDDLPDAADEAAVLCPELAGASADQEVAVLRAWLAGLVGPDADLVIDAVVLERPRRELGAARGIDERAARKRLQRALGRVRRCLGAKMSASRAGTQAAFGRA